MRQLRDLQDLMLVRAAKAGRGKAFDAIVARYQRRIYNLAFHLCGSVAEAEDATQEAFVAAYRGLGDYKGDSSLDTWLHRVAVNACLMRRRRGAPASEHDAGPLGDDAALASAEPDPLGVALHGELSAVLHGAVRRLPEAQQTVVLLHGMQGLTYTEISKILDCPVGTVKSRLAAAFTTLRRLLGGYVQGDTPLAAGAATEASR